MKTAGSEQSASVMLCDVCSLTVVALSPGAKSCFVHLRVLCSLLSLVC